MRAALFLGYILGSFWTKDHSLVKYSWNHETEHLVQVESFKKTIRCNVSCPLIYLGESSVNMQSAITAVSIKGEICVLSSSDVNYYTESMKAFSCVTSATTTGPLLAVGDGGGCVRLFNQDVNCLHTAFTNDAASAVTAMTLYKATSEYMLITACRDRMIRRYNVPWCLAHSRSPTTLPAPLELVKSTRSPIYPVNQLHVSSTGRLIISGDKTVTIPI